MGNLRDVRYAVALIVLLALTSCSSRQPGDPIRPGMNLYSPEQDVEIGKQAATEVRQQVDIVDDAELQGYINGLGQRLAKSSLAGSFPYSFTLINEPSINAFALPGGPIFVNSGLIDAAETEGQLAGVLAHEISHVALRHGTNQATKASVLQLPAVLAGVALGDQGALGQVATAGVGFGLNALILKYSRGAEKQADLLGARIMSEAGYNPIEMSDFFERLEAEGGQRAPAFLSSHPNPGHRSELVQEEIQALPPRDYGTATGRFASMKARVAQLPPPKKPASTAGAPPAVGGLERLEAGSFSMEYPSGWQVYRDEQTGSVTIVPDGGAVRTGSGGVAVGYGIITGTSASRGGSLESETQRLIAALQSADESVQPRGAAGRITLSGQPALVTELAGESPFGGAERNILVTVQRPNGLFYAVFVTPEAHYAQMQPAYDRMLRSIQFASGQ